MRHTESITILAALCTAVASAERASAGFTPTYYSDPVSWSSAVGGSNECTWDFDPIGTPVWQGWGEFTDQYAEFGMTAPGTWTGSGQVYGGLPYTQIGMSSETEWVFTQLGLRSGVGATGWLPFELAAPVNGVALHLVGATWWSDFYFSLFRGGEYVGGGAFEFGSLPNYGEAPSAEQTSVLVAFTSDVEFDMIKVRGGFRSYFGVESFWVPTSAIPSPGGMPILALMAAARRRRR